MRTKRKIIHVVSAIHMLWDLTEKKWAIWPRYIGCSSRYLHSARRARRYFEKLRRLPPCFRQARWLTYQNGRLIRVKSIGYMEPFPIGDTLEVDHGCLNTAGTWWIELMDIMSKKRAAREA